MNKKRVLIIDTHPFGKLVDSYKWCDYLRKDYIITLICLYDDNRVEMDGVNIIRVSTRGSYKVRGIRFVMTCLLHMLFFQGAIFAVYFEHCNFLKKVLFWKRMHVDIRTASIISNDDIRNRIDAQIRKECEYFDTISVISKGVRERLHLERATILPLGADEISKIDKKFDHLSLLYVGTFDGRDLIKTVVGLHQYLNDNPNANIHYDMVGGYSTDHGKKDYYAIKEYIGVHHLERIITMHGRISHDQLTPFFDKCNIGVSFVPITEYYDKQPPTKTFEYVFSGLYTIATGTSANKEIVSIKNGIIINDTPEGFASALEWINGHAVSFKSEMIRESLLDYSWRNIVEQDLIPILLRK